MIGLVLAAAGSGQRFGSEIPKQFLEVEGSPVYLHAFSQIARFSSARVIVTNLEHLDRVRSQLRGNPEWIDVRVVPGGETRQESVRQGVRALPPEVTRVLVHDAARPFVSPDLVERVLRGLDQTGACIPACPISETVKQVRGRRIIRTLDRNQLVLVQTPQAFQRNLLEEVLEWASQEGVQGTDEASLVELRGKTVEWVHGDPANIKITWPRDLESAHLGWQNQESSQI